MLIQVTTAHGEMIQIPDAVTVWYIRPCPYKYPHEFKTADYRKVFCCTSHQVMYCAQKKPFQPSIKTPTLR